MLLRGLYESWLLRSTREPLAPWQRGLLLKALQEDAALRQWAQDLAEFSHEEDAPAAVKAPDLRVRLVHLALESEIEAEPAPARARWVLAATTLALLAALVGFDWLATARPSGELARVAQPELALALSLPTATPTAAVTATPTAAAPSAGGPGPSPTAAP